MSSALHRGGRRTGTSDPRPAATYRIRTRRPKDLPACVRLLRVVHTHDRYPLRWPDAPRAWLSEPTVLDAWIAERLGEVLGHVAIGGASTASVDALRWREITGRPLSDLGFVTRLFVRPRVRHTGVAADLLDVATGHVRARRLVPVLEVVDNCADAVRLVETRGWRLLATDRWPGERGLAVHRYAAPAGG